MHRLDQLGSVASVAQDRARFLARVLRTTSFKAAGSARGNVLVSYVTEPFFLDSGAPIPTTHSQHWEATQIVRTYLEQGFNVDVIHYLNRWWQPRKAYAVAVDARHNLQRLSTRLGPDCTKIFHIDTCHMLFQNDAELRRLLDLQHRRGVTLSPRRQERLNFGIEHADYGVVLGNKHTIGTYAYSGKPLFEVPVSSPMTYPAPAGKPIDDVRRRFVWLSRGGLVLKGLDRVLEAFAGLPDHHLTVCAPIHEEPDFAAVYRRELYESPNIRTLGWVDVGGQSFADLLANSIGIVYPAGSESQSTSVINCMHGGLIPIATPESGLDLEADFGVLLDDDRIDTVREAVVELSERPAPQLAAMGMEAWGYARAHHSHESFATAYREVVADILADAGR
jgi:hypothetical protein